jgi:putative nucleotidyltransferase with HDIG domain
MTEGKEINKGDELLTGKGGSLTSTQESLPAKLGAELIIRFYRLLKAADFYNRNNIQIKKLTLDLLQTINAFIHAEGALSLKIIRESFFFNKIRMPMKADQYSLLKNFSQEMVKRCIGEIEFVSEIQEEALKDFIYLLAPLEGKNESNFLFINQQLEVRGIQNIIAGKLDFLVNPEEIANVDEQKKRAKKIFFHSIHLVQEVAEGVKKQKMVNIRKAKHLMENTVNSIMQDESMMLSLANIKNYDDYTFNHSVNVAIYAIALGQRIGIPKKFLSHLGMAGIFHDIGKTKIPIEILNKPEKLNPEDWIIIRRHPVLGAETILRIKEWGELSARMVHGAFDHHLKFDLSGYPKLSRKRNPSLFGKIITLADFYDSLARPRVYRKVPYISEKILGFMLQNAGKDFDPVLVKVFVNMVGIIPIGTLVLLDTQEMGIVIKLQDDPNLGDRPVVGLLSYSNGEYRRGKEVNLKETDEETGAFKRTIMKTLDPNEYNLNIAEFLI